MNPKKNSSKKKVNKASGIIDSFENQIDKNEPSKKSINLKKPSQSIKAEQFNGQNSLSQKLRTLDNSFRKQIELDQYLKQQAISFKKDFVTLDKLNRLLQNPDLLTSLGNQLKENSESFVTTLSLIDPVISQRKIIRNEIREIVHTLNKLQ